ncbi:MAG: hypothetical protein ACP5KD_05475 [Fervidobacterium sp.]|jgi:hypothetical protein
MRIEGMDVNPYTLQNVYARKVANRDQSQTAQVQQIKDLTLQVLNFALYKQQDVNVKLVRIAGELFQGKNLDVTA